MHSEYSTGFLAARTNQFLGIGAMIEWVLILIRFLHGLVGGMSLVPCGVGEYRETSYGPVPLDLLLSGRCWIPSVGRNLSKPVRPAGV